MKIFAVLSLSLMTTLAHADLSKTPICEDAPANRIPKGVEIKFTQALEFRGKHNVASVTSNDVKCTVTLKRDILATNAGENDIPANMRTVRIKSIEIAYTDYLLIKLDDEALEDIVCPAKQQVYTMKDVAELISGFAPFQSPLIDCKNPAGSAIPTGTEGGGLNVR